MAPAAVSVDPVALSITFAKAKGSLKSPSITTPETADCENPQREVSNKDRVKKIFFMIMDINQNSLPIRKAIFNKAYLNANY